MLDPRWIFRHLDTKDNVGLMIEIPQLAPRSDISPGLIETKNNVDPNDGARPDIGR